MEFGQFPIADCDGAILAHSLMLADGRIKKGTVLGPENLAKIKAAGFEFISVAKLGATDIGEDEAAKKIAENFLIANISIREAGAGRVNFYAEESGVFQVSKELVDAINRIDPSITLATLENFCALKAGRMVATVKIISYGVDRAAICQIKEMMEKAKLSGQNLMTIKAYQSKTIGVISTLLPSLNDKTIAKTMTVLEQRLSESGGQIVCHCMCQHNANSVAREIIQLAEKVDLLILFGASAISDMKDVLPQGLVEAGGKVNHFGMPVDPGNLLMLGTIGDVPVIGAPGCARSPAENGFDFILQRLLADISVSSEDISGMGVGGLLMEIASRPKPREIIENRFKLAGIVLAAGRSRRMGEANKMVVDIEGKAMICHPVESLMSANIKPILVVTGFSPDAVHSALEGKNVQFVHNNAFAEGLSTSLKAGISALDDEVTHALILLGDMPLINGDHLAEMRKTAEENPDHIIMGMVEGKRGNPVLWPKQYFEQLCTIRGDVGARHIVGENSEMLIGVELGNAAGLDLDTPKALDDFNASKT